MRYRDYDKKFHLSFTQLLKGWGIVAFIFLVLGYAWGWGAMKGATERAEETRDRAEIENATLKYRLAEAEAKRPVVYVQKGWRKGP